MPAAGGTVALNLVLQSSAVSVPAPRGDANGFTWRIGKAGGLERGSVFPVGVGTPRLLIERGGLSQTFAGPCPATGSCAAPTKRDSAKSCSSRRASTA